MILSLRSDRFSVVSHKYIKKSRTGCLKTVASLNIKNSKHQISNNKQYPNSKLEKIGLAARSFLRSQLKLNVAFHRQPNRFDSLYYEIRFGFEFWDFFVICDL